MNENTISMEASLEELNLDASGQYTAATNPVSTYASTGGSTNDSGSGSTYNSFPTPHGNYQAFTCNQVAVCNDGIGESYNDKYHLSMTAYMDGVLNADVHRYIVIPGSVSNRSSYLGCVGVAVRIDGTYVFGVVGDIGPTRDEGILDEYSVKMVKDLGFETDGANYVRPAEVVNTYIFTDTKRSSWSSSTLNTDVETEGKKYFY